MPTTSELFQTLDWKGSSKVFILLFILSVIFFIFYILIKPDKSRKIGILSFPTTGPYVPLDSSNCGRNVVNCTDQRQTCKTLCNSDKDSYECTLVPPGKEVWYLGTKLSSPVGNPQEYCLPKQNMSVMNSCGTYTGKALWAQDHWTCQCKYPSLFNGSDCNNPVACNLENGDPLLNCVDKNCGKLVRADNKKVVWDPNIKGGMDPIAEADNPLDRLGDKPMYSCNCDDTRGSYPKDGDPYRCHSNLCYAGSSNIISQTAQFNHLTNECECDNVTTVKSNVTGFCYPIGNGERETGCVPDLITGNCTCGNVFMQTIPDVPGIWGMFFKRGSDIYVTCQIPNDALCEKNQINPRCPTYKVLINNSTAMDKNNKKIIDTLKTTLIDITGAIIEFQLMQYTTLTSAPLWSDINSLYFQNYIQVSYPKFSTINNATLAIKNVVSIANQTIPIPCDSYFYNRSNGIGCPPEGCVKCNDSYYASSDQNNKNGTMCYNPVAGQTCGGYGKAISSIFDHEGYTCDCSQEGDCVYGPIDKPYIKPDKTISTDHVMHQCDTCVQCLDEPCQPGNNGCGPCHHCNGSWLTKEYTCGG